MACDGHAPEHCSGEASFAGWLTVGNTNSEAAGSILKISNLKLFQEALQHEGAEAAKASWN